MNNLNKIPSHWKWVTLDDIGIVTSGGTPSTKEPEFWNGDIPWVTPADLSNYKDIYISKGKRNISTAGLEYSSATLLPKNSILFSSRAPIGYVAISRNKLATNQGFKNIILFERSINSKFVYYYLKTIKEFAENMASGTTFLELSISKFKQIPFPLAPIEEQNRVVSKIEELFSELDRNIIQLQESKSKIEQTKIKLLDRLIVNNNSCQELKNFITEINYGYTTKSFRNKKNEKDLYYLRITDIQNGNIDWETVPFCDTNDADVEKFIIETDDILFARSGNTVGKTILINNPPKALYASYLIRIKCNKEILDPKFLAYYFQSNFYWIQLNNGVTGIGQPNFNGTKLSNLLVPNLSIRKQRGIVKQLDNIFSKLDKLNIEIEDNINKALLLKSKISTDAFLGKMSKQLSTDSNTESMLEDIKINKRRYTNKQYITNKEKGKTKRNNFNLIEIIERNFKNSLFSYSELYSIAGISRDRLKLKFEELENEGLIVGCLDKQIGTLKYKLI